MEHTVEAVLPASWEAKLLAIAKGDPCLLIRRRTFVGDNVVTSVRLIMPGGRSRIESKQTAGCRVAWGELMGALCCMRCPSHAGHITENEKK